MATFSVRSLLSVVAVAAMLPISAGAVVAAEELEEFYGTYVGSGTAEHVAESVTEQRDLDVAIEPYKDDGFTLKWITVIRGADGKRVGGDVKRREVEENFLPLEDKPGVFILAARGGLFQSSELPNPLRGEPMRWAKIEKGMMTVYSMAISDDGGSELQVYRRTLTDEGMDLSFLRLHDETVAVTMEGSLVRAD